MARGVCVRDVLDVIAAFIRDTISPHLWRDEVEVRVRFKGGPWVMLATLHRTELEGGGAGPPASGARGPARRAQHSPDFRSYTWGQERYSFTPGQAAVVRVLQEAKDNGTPDVGQDTLMEAAGSEGSRLRDLFKAHPAWGNLIVRGDGKGTLRLVDPE
jgi:hypothetical protein